MKKRWQYWRNYKWWRGSIGAPSLPESQNCTSTNFESIHETIDHTNAPKRPKATIEEIEDKEEVQVREKLKAKGSGILEDVEERDEKVEDAKEEEIKSMTHANQ